MTRTQHCQIHRTAVLVCAAASLLTLCFWPACSTSPEIPFVDRTVNVLIVTMDTLRADHLPAYGYPRDTAPTISRLARRGTLWKSAICTAPYTTPSHASLMTGLYPWSMGVRTNYSRLDSNYVTLAERFQSAGYQTAAFVSGSPLMAGVCGLHQGFDVYDDTMTQRVYTQSRMLMAAGDSIKSGAGSADPDHARVTAPYARRSGEQTLARALKWMEEVRADSPWFIWLHLYDIHGPYLPRSPLNQLFLDDPWDPWPNSLEGVWIPEYQAAPGADRADYVARYDAMIYTADRYLEKLIVRLQETRQADHTVILILADHGESLGENDYGFDHGRDLYSPCLNVPLIAVLPGSFQANLLSTQEISVLDIHPSIVTLFRLNAGKHESFSNQDGEPLMLRPGIHRVPVWRYAESKPNHPEEPQKRIFTVWDGRNKYIYRTSEPESEYFDLLDDPGETVNNRLNQDARRTGRILRRMIETSINPVEPAPRSDNELGAREKDALRSLGYIVE